MKYIHPFPARMAPEIALDFLGNKKQSLQVLDPMVGSGTVLAVAQKEGHSAIGLDLDPLAILISRARTSKIGNKCIEEEAIRTLVQAKLIYKKLLSRNAYPINCDEVTKRFIRYWFDPYVRRQLASLAIVINKIKNENKRNIMWCAFSRLIIAKKKGVSLAMDLSHSRPHKVYNYGPIKPFTYFIPTAIGIGVKIQDNRKTANISKIIIKRGDARKLRINDNSIDIILTSPPYINGIDYLRCSKFSLVWMGYQIGEIRKIRQDSIGAESKLEDAINDQFVKQMLLNNKYITRLEKRKTEMISRYIYDIEKVISEGSRVLKKGGKAVFVVGESMIGGTYISNSKIITQIAEQRGLVAEFKKSRIIPDNHRYLPPPKKQKTNQPIDSRIRHEVILVFKKQ